MMPGDFVMTRCGILSGWCEMTARIVLACIAAVLVAGLSSTARADEDLPGRVGRIADFAGRLYLSPEDRAAAWAEIGLNYPVTSGDNLWVSGEGRAEVDYGGGQFRLTGDTNLHVSRLDDRQLALFVAQGRLIVRVRVLDPGEAARVDAPNTQVQLTRPGLYRIDVTPDRQATVVTVREGEALVALAAGTQQALPGQTVTITGQDQTVADIRNGIGQDGFDAWSANRDRYYERGGSAAYVSRQMVGYAELDEYGGWQTDPEYGPVWFPAAVAPDWVPYRDGYWANVGGWGATWVDFAPWGYAPFHYGRWAWVGGRWGWCPGRYVARPVWAPALVAWHGGPGWGLSASYGSPVYGWVPLGWRDPYLPSWRGCSARCWTHYNQPYGVNMRERPRVPPSTYANSAVPGAITAVAGATLIGAGPVSANRVRVPPQVASAAPVLGAAPPVASAPAHLPSGRPGAGVPPPASTIYPAARQRPVNPAIAPEGPDSATPEGRGSTRYGGGAAGTVPPPRPATTPGQPPVRTSAPAARPTPAPRVERGAAGPALPPSMRAAPAPPAALVAPAPPAAAVAPAAQGAPQGGHAPPTAVARPGGGKSGAGSQDRPQGGAQGAAPAPPGPSGSAGGGLNR